MPTPTFSIPPAHNQVTEAHAAQQTAECLVKHRCFAEATNPPWKLPLQQNKIPTYHPSLPWDIILQPG